MKKLIVGFACCCLFSMGTFMPVTSYSQSSTSTGKMSSTDKEGSVKMKDGKVMIMRNGSWSGMTSTTTLTDGSQVMTDGTVVKKDGTKKMLKNGECVKPDGTMKKM